MTEPLDWLPWILILTLVVGFLVYLHRLARAALQRIVAERWPRIRQEAMAKNRGECRGWRCANRTETAHHRFFLRRWKRDGLLWLCWVWLAVDRQWNLIGLCEGNHQHAAMATTSREEAIQRTLTKLQGCHARKDRHRRWHLEQELRRLREGREPLRRVV